MEGTPYKSEGPQPLVREIPAGEAISRGGAWTAAKGAVEAVQGMTQAPVAIPAQSALAVASSGGAGLCQRANTRRGAARCRFTL